MSDGSKLRIVPSTVMPAGRASGRPDTDRIAPLSTSLAPSRRSSVTTAPSSLAAAASAAATVGASLTAVTSRLALAASVSSPSVIVKLISTLVPLKLAAGIKVNVPSLLSVIVPNDVSTDTASIDRVSPSTSELFASKSAAVKVMAVSSFVVPRSTLPAIGAVFVPS